MTTEELCLRLEEKLDGMNAAFTSLCERVAKHTEFIANHANETKMINDRISSAEQRMAKTERLLFFVLGGGGAAGFGVAKMFF